MKVDYGTYAKYKNGFTTYFHNPITKENEYLGFMECESDALQAIKERNFKLFEEHPYLLPTSIGVWRARKQYTFDIKIKGKNIRIGQYNTITDAVNAKKELINSLYE